MPTPSPTEKPSPRRVGRPLAAVRGLSRALLLDPHWRRTLMVYLIGAAFGMMIVGGTVGFDFLRARVPLFFGFWLACAAFTLLATLLALYDLLALRLQARRARRELRARLEVEEPKEKG